MDHCALATGPAGLLSVSAPPTKDVEALCARFGSAGDSHRRRSLRESARAGGVGRHHARADGPGGELTHCACAGLAHTGHGSAARRFAALIDTMSWSPANASSV